MDYLWLTLCDPDPQTNGQFIYSGGLIRAVANAGVRLTVQGLSRQPGRAHYRREPNIDWHFAGDLPPGRRSRAMSRFPLAALRTRVPDMRTTLVAHLRFRRWDALILDSLNVGWALPHALRYRRRYPHTKIVYLAHNHEAAAARALAQAETGWLRAFRFADALKTERLERQLVQMTDVAATNSPDDSRVLATLSPGKPVIFVPPGYAGRRIPARTMTTALPRRAIVVGSFDWAAKRLGLEGFLSIATPLFAANGIELQVVGRTEESYVAALRRRFPSVDIVGTVPDVRPYMAAARVALVPDVLGGFKLKSLDYIFNRVPIFALRGAVPGTPLEDRRGIRLFEKHVDLAHGVVDAIDNVALLNRQQEMAYMLSANRFDWSATGRDLVQQIQKAPVRRDEAAKTFASAECRLVRRPSG